MANNQQSHRPFDQGGLLGGLTDGAFWLTLALTVFAVAPFALPGYFWGANDARHHVYFLFEYDRVVQDGIWWPRWSPDFAFGYGYPFFNIYGPFSHFLAELLLHFLGFSYTGAIETVFAISIVGSAAAMYAYVRSWAGRAAAMVSALVYVYAPYHLLNLYVRANLAESMALLWLPLCLWTVREATLRPRFRWLAAAAVSYAGLMVTSNLVFVLFTPLLGLYLLVLVAVYRRGVGLRSWLQTLAAPVAGLAAGLGLSAVFWLPMALERQYVRVDQWFDGRYNFRGHFVYLFQLFSPRWGFGISQPGPDDPIGFQMGVAPLILAAIGLLAAWPRLGKLRWEMRCFLLAGVVTTIFALPVAAPLWELPLVGTILGLAQFPWRWFSVAFLCMSIPAGLIVFPPAPEHKNMRENMREQEPRGPGLTLIAVIAVVLISSYPMLRVEITEPAEGPVSLAALMRFQQSSDEMTGSTAWVKEIPTWSSIADEYISQEKAGGPVLPAPSKVDYTVLNYSQEVGFVVNSEAHNSVMEEVWYWSAQDGRSIIFNHFYYPGWKAYLLDGRHGSPVAELPIVPETEGTLGRMTVPVPAGEGFVLLRFEDTPPRTAGRAISLATAGLLIVVGALAGRRWNRQDTPS